MLISYKHNFVFFSLPKTGTTFLEADLTPHCDIIMTNPPRIKHTNVRRYQRFLEPFLNRNLDKIGVIREPIDWLFSWYKYLSRDALANPSHPSHFRYSGSVKFEEFAKDYLLPKKERQSYSEPLGSPSKFYYTDKEEVEMDYLFKYEEMHKVIHFFETRIGTTIDFVSRNASPKRKFQLSDDTREELIEFLKDDYMVYNNLTR
jgi:hypothetical protein